MNKKVSTLLLTLLMSMVSLQSFADFDTSTKVHVGDFYYYLDDDNHQAQVTWMPDGKYSGNITIPADITYERKVYSVTSIGEGAFCNCISLTTITIPNGVTSIGNNTFYGCYYLTSVTIPNGVTSIGDQAFAFCSSLANITIPVSVTTIGMSAFEACSSLTSVTIPNGVTSISQAAFSGCSSLTSVTIPNGVTTIELGAFSRCSSLTSVTIPNGVTGIGPNAFDRCSNLTSVIIPSSVIGIGEDAFGGCSGLTCIKVESDNPNYDSRDNCNAIIQTRSNLLIAGCKNTVIPNSVTSIGMYAFDGCFGLTSIIIPNSVTKIGEGAFYGCSGLVSVTIGNNVTTMDNYVFYECSNLTSVTVLNPTPVSISEGYTFSNRKNATLYVPIGSKSAYQAADIWKDFKEIIEIDPAKIEQIMSEETPQTTIFTLDGKRIYKLQKGLNIIGGKKVVIK